MKKVLIFLVVLLFVLTGCNKNKTDSDNKNPIDDGNSVDISAEPVFKDMSTLTTGKLILNVNNEIIDDQSWYGAYGFNNSFAVYATCDDDLIDYYTVNLETNARKKIGSDQTPLYGTGAMVMMQDRYIYQMDLYKDNTCKLLKIDIDGQVTVPYTLENTDGDVMFVHLKKLNENEFLMFYAYNTYDDVPHSKILKYNIKTDKAVEIVDQVYDQQKYKGRGMQQISVSNGIIYGIGVKDDNEGKYLFKYDDSGELLDEYPLEGDLQFLDDTIVRDFFVIGDYVFLKDYKNLDWHLMKCVDKKYIEYLSVDYDDIDSFNLLFCRHENIYNSEIKYIFFALNPQAVKLNTDLTNRIIFAMNIDTGEIYPINLEIEGESKNVINVTFDEKGNVLANTEDTNGSSEYYFISSYELDKILP